MTKKSKMIRGIDEKSWNKFVGYAKFKGLTLAEFLKLLIKLYEQKEEKDGILQKM